MANVLLTSAVFVRTQTAISDNLSDKMLLAAIREAQDIDFREIVGTKMLEKLCALVESGEIELQVNSKYREILNKAQYYLAYVTASYLGVSTTYKSNNLGLHTNTDEYTQTPYFSEVMKLKDWWKARADHYCLLLQQYCVEHVGEFPEFDELDGARIREHLYSAASCNLRRNR